MNRYPHSSIYVLLVLLLMLIGLSAKAVLATSALANPQGVLASSGNTYYVSKIGNNGDGRSWATAWNELSQIAWSVIQPGDVILIDGGASEMIYQSTLTVGKSGTSSAPITIRLATEPGRDGKAIIFGGRTTPLPSCGQAGYIYQTTNVRLMGIYIGDHDWITIDGGEWGGITIYGHNQFGIRLRSGANNVTVRNMEIYDNGKAYQSGSAWYPDLPGIDLAGADITFERMIVHDNGQDAFQSGGVERFVLRNSWLYNGRRHPTAAEAFNYCRHTDGVQIYGGGEHSGVLVENSVIGPGFMQGLLLGDAGYGTESLSQWAVIHDVSVRNTLLYASTNANISSHTNSLKPRNWRLENVTSYREQGQQWHNVYLEGSGHTLTNSTFHGSSMTLSGNMILQGNCQYKTTGFTVGQTVDPSFVDVPNHNYAVTNSACSGSSLTSVAQLLGEEEPNIQPTPTATDTPTSTPTATHTPTPTPTPTVASARLRVVPGRTELGVGETVDVTLVVDAGTLTTNGVAAYLDYDPSVLQIRSVQAGGTLTTVLQNQFDNGRGQFTYAAGILGGSATGSFSLATVTFEAITPSPSTALTLSISADRQSDVTANGSSILSGVENASIAVSSEGILEGQVTLEGRPAPPDQSWSAPLHISLTPLGTGTPRYTWTTTSDERGAFRLDSIEPGTYHISIENSHTLRRVTDLTLLVGRNQATLGVLPEGDAIDDNKINLLDFSVLAGSYNRCQGTDGFFDNSDFNDDSCVNMLDFSLLAGNFGKVGDDAVHSTRTNVQDLVPLGSVDHKQAGQQFTVTVMIENEQQTVLDAASLALVFNPDQLKVIDVLPAGPLTTVAENSVDAQRGSVIYAAGILGGAVNTSLPLATITFEAMQDLTGADLLLNVAGVHRSDVAFRGHSLFERVRYEMQVPPGEVGAVRPSLYLPLVNR